MTLATYLIFDLPLLSVNSGEALCQFSNIAINSQSFVLYVRSVSHNSKFTSIVVVFPLATHAFVSLTEPGTKCPGQHYSQRCSSNQPACLHSTPPGPGLKVPGPVSQGQQLRTRWDRPDRRLCFGKIIRLMPFCAMRFYFDLYKWFDKFEFFSKENGFCLLFLESSEYI